MARIALLLFAFIMASCATTDINNKFGGRTSSQPIRWRADAQCVADTAVPPGATRNTLAIKCLNESPKQERDFLAMALSGGGTKAAVFSAEAMFYLEALDLLHRINVLSSVSGGSFTAGVYALSCDPTDLKPPANNAACAPGSAVWQHADVLNTVGQGYSPLLWEQVFRLAVPLVRATISPSRFASYIDKRFFKHSANQGQPFRFKDINPRRPYLAINATIISPNRAGLGGSKQNEMACDDDPPGYTRGWLRRRSPDEFYHFAYTDLYFDLLRSDLREFPVSGAVAASAAFPVLIDQAKLTDYCRDRADPDRELTLVDGGVNDNQGITEIYHILTELALNQRRSDVPQDQQQKLTKTDAAYIFVVNSSVSDTTGPLGSGSGQGPVGAIGAISSIITKVAESTDVLGATNFNVRKRLYIEAAESVKQNEKIAIKTIDIGLDKLDQYPQGGAIYNLWRKSGILQRPGRPNLEDDRTAAQTLIAKAALQATVSRQLIHHADNRKRLLLSNYHPQCYYDIRAKFDASLVSIPADEQACLREAARWSTALSAQELCSASGSQDRPPDGLRCDNGIARLVHSAALGLPNDVPGQCQNVLDPLIKEKQSKLTGKLGTEDCQLLPNN